MIRIDNRQLMDRGDASGGGPGGGGGRGGGGRGGGGRGRHAGAFSGIGESRTPGATSLAGQITGAPTTGRFSMFSPVQSFKALSPKQKKAFIATRVGLALASATPIGAALSIGAALASNLDPGFASRDRALAGVGGIGPGVGPGHVGGGAGDPLAAALQGAGGGVGAVPAPQFAQDRPQRMRTPRPGAVQALLPPGGASRGPAALPFLGAALRSPAARVGRR